jgi:dTDP-4-amino-4,6-dideoxygalactose transaminase
VIDRVVAAIRFASGSFTPFLLPLWDDADRALVDRFLSGDNLDDDRRRFEADRQPASGGVALAADSGRSAIRLALEAGGLRRGDEVALPSYSCFGVVAPVLALGLAPVFVDVDDTFNISMAGVESVASPRLKAVIVPHLGGLLARDAAAISAWARARDMLVIEDAAQAFGHPGVGRFGDLVVYSTGIGKPLFGPGGGWVAAERESLARALATRALPTATRASTEARVRAFVAQFGDRMMARGRMVVGEALRARISRGAEPDASSAAVDPARMSGIEAALARRQVDRIDHTVHTRRTWLSFWRASLASADLPSLRLPPEETIAVKVWAAFEGATAAADAARLKRALRAAGVEVEAAYTPLHLRAPLGHCRRGALTTTDRLWRHAFVLPARPNLAEADRRRFERACAAVRRRQS